MFFARTLGHGMLVGVEVVNRISSVHTLNMLRAWLET